MKADEQLGQFGGRKVVVRHVGRQDACGEFEALTLRQFSGVDHVELLQRAEVHVQNSKPLKSTMFPCKWISSIERMRTVDALYSCTCQFRCTKSLWRFDDRGSAPSMAT